MDKCSHGKSRVTFATEQAEELKSCKMKDEGGFTNGQTLLIVESLLCLKNYNTTCYAVGAD